MPRLNGQVHVVTGGNSGLGLAAVGVLARKGAVVVLACRGGAKRGEAAKRKLNLQAIEAKTVHPMELDLTSFASIRQFVADLQHHFGRLDGLMLNAGLGGPRAKVEAAPPTIEGFEAVFGTNHVGHFYLTILLLPLLMRQGIDAPLVGRIVSVSSSSHWDADGLNFQAYGGGLAINGEDDGSPPEDLPPQNVDKARMYAESKLANIVFARALSARLEKHWAHKQRIADAGRRVLANSVQPGFVLTEMTRTKNRDQKWAMYSPEEAVLTQIYCQTSEDVAVLNLTGQHFLPIAALAKYGRDTSLSAASDELGQALWNWSLRAVQRHDAGIIAPL